MDVIKERATYLNRYQDKIKFRRIGLLKFEMSGFLAGGVRQLQELDGRIISIDPSGGPSITAKYEGMDYPTDMGQFNKKWEGIKVISVDLNTTFMPSKIIIECEYILENIEWKKIKNPA